MSVIRNRSIRTVLGWQCYATIAIAALMFVWKGPMAVFQPYWAA